MSAGHGSIAHERGMSTQALERVVENPEVHRRMIQMVYGAQDDTYDLPYLAGYSITGDRLFFDRHLPELLTLQLDGQKKEIEPRQFLRWHEGAEKAAIDILNWDYVHAHSFGNGMERRHVLQEVGPGWWPPYQQAMAKYVKADEREKLSRVPRDLDMTPYLAPPVDEALVKHMQRAMGYQRRFTKAQVEYEADGSPDEHCGPARGWPIINKCEHFETPGGCELVQGAINPKGWCNKWSRIT